MFWRKKTEQEPAAGAAAPPAAELDIAVEGAASILRALGKHAFAIGDESAETITQRLEQWASHLLVLAPLPAKGGGSSVSSLPPRPATRRAP